MGKTGISGSQERGIGLRMSVNLIFKIAAVGILVTVISQVLKHSGREEHAFLTSLAGPVSYTHLLGKKADFQAVEQAVCSGVRILGTVHADTVEELWEKPYLKKWMKRGIFKRFILIRRSRSGEREFQVFNGKRERLC